MVAGNRALGSRAEKRSPSSPPVGSCIALRLAGEPKIYRHEYVVIIIMHKSVVRCILAPLAAKAKKEKTFLELPIFGHIKEGTKRPNMFPTAAFP